MRDVRKIHFINRIDHENVGDWNCSPIEYYYGYFKDFNILRHDIGSVDLNEIQKDDVVILGGGGLFNVLEPFNLSINSVLEVCDHVIAWSCGFNTHNERLKADEDFTPIDMKRFEMVSIRDYEHPSGIEYLPCPTVKALRFDIERKPIRKIGVIYHRSMPEISSLPFESISNNESISRINDFILDSEAIVTNSYHCAYWASLLERKAIVANRFSSKFDSFKYMPEFVAVSPDNMELSVKMIDRAFERAAVYSGIMEEAEKMNDAYFERVKGIIEGLGFPKSNDYQNFYLLNTTKDLRFDKLKGEVALLNDSVMWIYDKIDKIVQLEQSCITREQILEKKCSDLQTYIIKQFILRVTKGKRTALAGGGLHTLKLLELLAGEKEICFIAAKEHKYDFGGIPLLTYDELAENMADAIIVSSYVYGNEIKEELQKRSLNAEIIDLYAELEKNGLPLRQEFWLV
ncbi:MAG: polysaccharide pyruvyl transferase family protein [Lachnospiraceae bacterium]|nr:polysaccharide pyruvyl transferase family protein [Lachnospiraceae bacterium]